MKQPAKLLASLIFGLSALSLGTVAYAGGNGGSCSTGGGGSCNKSGGSGGSCNNGGGNGGSCNNGGHEGGDDGGGSSSTSCTGTVVTACGLQIVKSVCSSSTDAEHDGHENEEHQHAESDDRENDDYDGHGHNNADHDRDSPSNHQGQDYSFQYYYDSNGNMQEVTGGSHAPAGVQVVNVSNGERLGTSPDGKITICHRMGGAEVTLDIPDDQINGVKAHGHGNHPLDTIGRCEDEDDSDPAHDTVPRQKLDQSPNITTSIQSCLSAPAGTPVTVTPPGGAPWTGPAPGCNASGVSCSVPLGGTASGATLQSNGLPNRGGVRTLR